MSAEVKPGFKQTEAGVLPVDWEAKKLGEVASFRTGPFGSALHKSDYTNDGIPVVNPMHILDGRIVPTTSMTITEEAAKSLDEFRLSLGEVIIGRRGDMGRCAVVSERERGWLCGTGSMIVRPSISVNAYFLQRVLSTPSIIKAIEDSSVGSTMINLNQGTLSNLVVQAPSVEEQRAIAATLSDMDALISNLDQLVIKKRDIRQAAMQQLLTGQRRLPGFSGEWEVGRLGDFGRCLRGVSYKGDADLFPYDNDETYRLLRSNNVQQSAIVTDGLQFVNARCVSDHQILKPDDILICMANGSKELVGKAGLFKVSDGHEYTFGAFMGCFRIAANAVPNFIFALFGTHKFKSYIANLLAGSSINNLRPCDIEQMEFSFPLKNEQTAIATVLSDMGAELAALEVRREKATQLKQGMMQELLTGRIRLA